MVKIIKPTASDVPDLVFLGRLMHQESRSRGRPFMADNVARYALSVISDEYNFFVRMTRDDQGSPTGFIVGKIEADVINNDIFGKEVYLYVRPDSRGTRAFLLLFRSLEKWFKDQGDVVESKVGTTSEIQTDKTCALYKKMGYNYSGSFFVKSF